MVICLRWREYSEAVRLVKAMRHALMRLPRHTADSANDFHQSPISISAGVMPGNVRLSVTA